MRFAVYNVMRSILRILAALDLLFFATPNAFLITFFSASSVIFLVASRREMPLSRSAERSIFSQLEVTSEDKYLSQNNLYIFNYKESKSRMRNWDKSISSVMNSMGNGTIRYILTPLEM
jgi:hypothetical protein